MKPSPQAFPIGYRRRAVDAGHDHLLSVRGIYGIIVMLCSAGGHCQGFPTCGGHWYVGSLGWALPRGQHDERDERVRVRWWVACGVWGSGREFGDQGVCRGCGVGGQLACSALGALASSSSSWTAVEHGLCVLRPSGEPGVVVPGWDAELCEQALRIVVHHQARARTRRWGGKGVSWHVVDVVCLFVCLPCRSSLGWP